MKTRLIIVIMLSCVLMFSAVDPISAKFQVVGSLLRTDVTPGEHIAHEITIITGENDTPADYQAGLFGFDQSLEGNYLPLDHENDTGPYTARPFLTLSPSTVHVEPGGSGKLMIEGDIPQDAEGGLYALAAISSSPEGSGTVGISMAIYVPIMLTVSGTNITDAGEITSMEVLDPVPSKEYKLSITFKNTGNHHYRTMENATLMDSAGNILGTGSLADDMLSLVPSYTRLFEIPVSLESELAPGNYRALANVSRSDGTLLDSEEIEFEIE